MKKLVRSLMAASVLVSGVIIAAPTASAQQEPCGYFEGPVRIDAWGNSSYENFYNHCAPGRVLIQVDGNLAAGSKQMCVGQGITPIGVSMNGFLQPRIENAYYIGGC